MTARDVKVLRQADAHLLAGATDGVYRSADRGLTWQHIGLQDREVLEVMPAPQDRGWSTRELGGGVVPQP